MSVIIKEGLTTDSLYKGLKVISIFVDNSLDQSVTIQLKANRANSSTGAVNVGSSFSVAASSTDSRSLTPDTAGWLPYLFATVVCSVAPASGNLTVYAIRSKTDETKIFDTLAIRDTNTHTGSIVEW
jgi:hypothetical protein